MKRLACVIPILFFSYIAQSQTSQHAAEGDTSASKRTADAASLWKTSHVRSFEVTQDLVDAVEWPTPLHLPTDGRPEVAQISNREPSPFWKTNLKILDEEIRALMKESTVFKRHVLANGLRVTVIGAKNPIYGFELALSPEDFQNRGLLRFKLAEVAGRLTQSGAAFGVLDKLKDQKVKTFAMRPVNGIGSGPLSHLGFAQSYALSRGVPAKSTLAPVPDVAMTAAHTGTYGDLQRLRDFYKGSDSEREKYYEDQMEREAARTKARGKDLRKPTGDNFSTSLISLLDAYRAKTGDQAIFGRWFSHLNQALDDPTAYRFFLSKYENQPEPSLDHILDLFERKLSASKKETFRKLRMQFGLSGENLVDMEARYHSGYADPDDKWEYGELLAESGRRVLRSNTGPLPPLAHGDEAPEADPRRLLRSVIDANEFKVTRGLSAYFSRFSPEALEKIASLGADGHWIDMGSGEGVAIEEYFKLKNLGELEPGYLDYLKGKPTGSRILKAYEAIANKPVNKRVQVTGITKVMNRKIVPDYGGHLRNLTGRYLEEIPNSEITKGWGKADVITDMFGVFAYAPPIDDVLRTYLRLLKSDGRIFIYFPEGSMTKSTVTISEGGNHKEIPLPDWIDRLGRLGLTIQWHDRLGGNGSLEISLAKGVDPDNVANAIPRIRLQRADDATPPVRFYKELER